MTIESFEKAKLLMVKKENYQRHLDALKEVQEKYSFGKIKFEKSGYSPVDIQPPRELGMKFIQDVIEYYQSNVEKIDSEMEAL